MRGLWRLCRYALVLFFTKILTELNVARPLANGFRWTERGNAHTHTYPQKRKKNEINQWFATDISRNKNEIKSVIQLFARAKTQHCTRNGCDAMAMMDHGDQFVADIPRPTGCLITFRVFGGHILLGF